MLVIRPTLGGEPIYDPPLQIRHTESDSSQELSKLRLTFACKPGVLFILRRFDEEHITGIDDPRRSTHPVSYS